MLMGICLWARRAQESRGRHPRLSGALCLFRQYCEGPLGCDKMGPCTRSGRKELKKVRAEFLFTRYERMVGRLRSVFAVEVEGTK